MLGWCLADGAASRNGDRQLWYDEVVGWLDSHLAVSCSFMYPLLPLSRSLQTSLGITDALIGELENFSNRPFEPYSNVMLYASTLLARISLGDEPNNLLLQISNLEQGE